MINKIRQDLFEMQDLKYKEFHGSLCPDMDNIIGVRIPKLREYAKELYEKVGFVQKSESFLEDGIPHVLMQYTE